MSDQSLADEMFDELGAVDPLMGRTPEGALFYEHTESNRNKIACARHWLHHELYLLHHLMACDWLVCKMGRSGAGSIARVQVPTADIAREMLKYYYHMTALPRFQNSSHRPAADIDVFLDLIMQHPEIIRTINQKFS